MNCITGKYIPPVLIALFIMATAPAMGQKKQTAGWWQKDWLINVSGGGTLAMGDMKFSWDGNADIKEGYSLWLGKQLTPSLGLRFQIMNSRLSGTGMLYQNSIASDIPAEFKANIFEYNLSAFYYFLKPHGQNEAPRSWNIYATAGAGYVHWITAANSLVDKTFIASNGNKPFGKGINGRTLEAVFPVGIGADFMLGTNLKLNLESNLHTVSSDKLDNKVAGFPYDQYLYTSAGLSYRFNTNFRIWEPKTIELARYQTDPDLLPLRYTQFSSVTKGIVAPYFKDQTPQLSLKVPTMLTTEPEVNIAITFQNAGREGILDLDFAFQPEFQMEVSDKNRFLLSPNGQGANLQFKVNAGDTNNVYTLRLLTASVPNGSFPFFMTGRFVAYSGETFHFKEMEYIEKDAGKRIHRSGYDSVPEGLLSGIKFRVQVLSSKDNPIPESKIKTLFPDEEKIREENESGWYYYTTGEFGSRDEADEYKKKLEKRTGLSGMYSVMYQNDKRSHKMEEIYEGYQSELGKFDALGKHSKSSKRSVTSQSSLIDEYRVRFHSSHEFRASLAELETRMGTDEKITEMAEGENYEYYAGSFRKKTSAIAYAEYLRQIVGFTDVDVVAFKKGKPVR